MSKLQFHSNKTLRLTNLLSYRLMLNIDFKVEVEKMHSYIRVKGAQ